MTAERQVRLLERLAARGAEPDVRRLCEVCVEVTGASGAGIMLISDEVVRGSVYATDDVSALIEELQFALGEGPCVDAHEQGRPVAEPDLGHPEVRRWPAFSGRAADAGVAAVFGFPLGVAAARLGALDLYRDTAGPLSDEQHADALVMADITSRTLLAMQARAPADQVAVGLAAAADFHFVVHQAAGMVSVQLGVSVERALLRLRAHAFGNEVELREVAAQVVARRLRFDAGNGERDAAVELPGAATPPGVDPALEGRGEGETPC